MYFKGRVKTLTIGKKEYEVSFIYSDTIRIKDEDYGIAYDIDNNDDNTITLKALAKDKTFSADKEIFDFISQHSKETLIAEYKKNNITKVELFYE